MIATVSVQESNKYESVSTCRFAQRVALVDNDAHRNEVLDDKTLIKRLRKRIAELQVGRVFVHIQISPNQEIHRQSLL
jgi:kinesin family protein 6/9